MTVCNSRRQMLASLGAMSNKTPAAAVVRASVTAVGPCLTAQHTMLSPCGIAA